MLERMDANRALTVLLAIALLGIDACAFQAAKGHFWPEIQFLFLIALFTSQLATLVAAGVLYRGLAVLRISAAVCLVAVWCRSGSLLIGDLQDWAAMAAIVILSLATLVLTARWLVTRQALAISAERNNSHKVFGVGDLIAGVTVIALLFASVRATVDSPLARPEFCLSIVAAVLSVPFILTLLTDELKPSQVLFLVPLTVAGALTLEATGTASQQGAGLWATNHAVLLSGSLVVLRAAGVRLQPAVCPPATLIDDQCEHEPSIPFEREFYTSC